MGKDKKMKKAAPGSEASGTSERKGPSMIEVSDVVKDYSGHRALAGISFNVKQGDFFGCFGPNGAGKTTLTKILTGALDPTSGMARVMDKDVKIESVNIRKGIGIVPESESPPSFLTGEEFLRFVCDLHGVSDADSRVKHWLEYFDLTESASTLCKDMSKGMRQKIMLSSAFIHEPPLLFLDEPMINLDPIYQKKLRDLLISFTREGRTIFMCSHILEMAEKVCTEIIILNRGVIIGQGSIASLRKENSENLEDVFMRLVREAGQEDKESRKASDGGVEKGKEVKSSKEKK